MTRIFAITTIVMILVATAAGQANSPKTNPDEEAIRAILLERVESFNRHEAPHASTFTLDADFVNVYGLWRKGSAEIEARQKERMLTALKDAKMKLIEMSIRFIKPDVAIVHQRHDMSGMRDAAGKTMPTIQELSIRVMVKEKGKWLTTAFHNTIVKPVEAPSLSIGETIRKLELAESNAVVRSDVPALEKLWAEDFTVNNPNNQVSRGRKEVLDLVRSGRLKYSSFEREIEAIKSYGDTVIVMGLETIVPVGDNPKAGQTVRRRYTNIWMKNKGDWLLSVRHANVICQN